MENTGTLTKQQIAELVVQHIPQRSYVNLGIGLPTLVADVLEPKHHVTLHTENGMLGMGRAASGDEIDPDLINAGKIPVLEQAGASYFHQADSFAMMRGGHLDICVLGGFQVSVSGDLANWHTPSPGSIPSVGGAMDLAYGAKNVYAMMTLFDKQGNPKIVSECTFPVTALECVSKVFTEYGYFRLKNGEVIIDKLYGITRSELEERLGFELIQGIPY